MDPKAIKLIRYRYGAGVPAIELQDRLQAVSVVKDISGKEDIQLSMIGSFEEPQHAFTPGDFIALQDQTGATWSWGRVSVVRSAMKRDIAGSLTHAPYAVMVQGWYDFMARAKVHVMNVASRASVGTLFNRRDWLLIYDELEKMYGQDAGAILQFIFSKVMRIRLPESMGGGWLSDEIPIVYNKETALRYAPEFEDIEPIEFSNLMPQLANGFMNVRSSDVGSIIANMFLFENSLVELVPYMSTLVTQPLRSPASGSSGAGEQTRTNLGMLLGAQPVLVYRVKPFRADPLYSAAVSKIHYTAEDVEAGYLDRELALYDETTRRDLLDARAMARARTTQKLFDSQQRMFARVTFNPESIVPLPYSYITSISRQRSDAERVNATTINAVPGAQPDSTTLTDVDYLALPVALDDQIENHGLRLRIAKWHLYPRDNDMTQGPVSPEDPGVDVFYRAVAAQVMQFYQKAHLYETGSMTLHFTHTLHEVETSDPNIRTYDKAVLGLEPGRWFRTMFQGMDDMRAPTPEPMPAGAVTTPRAPADEYYGYITSVTHNIQRMPSGYLTANTQANFQRGHFAELWELLNNVNVPLGDIDRPATSGGGGGRGRTGTTGDRSACSRKRVIPANKVDEKNPQACQNYEETYNNLLRFNGGVPSARGWAPFGALALTPLNGVSWAMIAARPAWLRCWFLQAVSVATVREYNQIKSKLDARYNEAGSNQPKNSEVANLWGLAACAYVIERYWQTYPGYEKAKIRIWNIPGAADGKYHTLWAAMDFSLEFPEGFNGEEPGAFQMWAALTRLADAGRIPEGGRGLYLNVHPDKGITGTEPSQAGDASGAGCNFPYGGSSYTHYDMRAAFGISLTGRPVRSTTWIATDWNGDGSDEITLGSPFPDPTEKVQSGGIADEEKYVFANIADPGFTTLDDYLSEPKASKAPGISALMLKRKNLPGGDLIENRREPVREETKKYFKSFGRNDSWLRPVTSAVPNMYQVLDLEALVAAQPTTAAPAPVDIQPDNINYAVTYDHFDLYISKDSDGDNTQAPYVMMFGGIDVNGNEARVYMKEYARPLFGLNHVLLARNDDVDFEFCFDHSLNGLIFAPNQPPEKRILYIFSNGVKPAYHYVKAVNQFRNNELTYGFDKIYMVDAWLGDNTQLSRDITKAFIQDMKARPDKYVFFYTTEWAENGMNAQTRLAIIGDGTSANRGIVALDKRPVTNTSGTTSMQRHLSANTAAVAHLRSSGLMK